MTTFTSYKIYSKSKNAIAIIGTFKVSFCLRNGNVYDASPVGSFTPAEGSIAFDYTFNAVQVARERLEGMSRLHLAKAEARKAEDLERAVIAYNKRKTDLINLWKWRHDDVTAYLVRHFDQCDEYNWDSHNVETQLFFAENEATTYFESVKENAPDAFHGNSGWKHYTELHQLSATHDALEILTTDDLIKEIFDHGTITEDWAKIAHTGKTTRKVLPVMQTIKM